MATKPGIANRLRDLRREYGLTQDKLADDLDVTRHTILALEVGRYVPSIELALQIASYFDQPLESIFWLISEDTADNARKSGKPKTIQIERTASSG